MWNGWGWDDERSHMGTTIGMWSWREWRGQQRVVMSGGNGIAGKTRVVAPGGRKGW